jgi:hypothetical protein
MAHIRPSAYSRVASLFDLQIGEYIKTKNKSRTLSATGHALWAIGRIKRQIQRTKGYCQWQWAKANTLHAYSI